MRCRLGLTRMAPATCALALACLAPAAAQASTVADHPRWAPAKSATIHPGVMVEMGDVSCRAGFVFTDGTHVFIGVPASCSGTGPSDNSKCDVGQDPVGTPVTISGAKHKGTLVYSSIAAMVLRGQTHKVNRCAYNDLSLVRLDHRDIKRTNPSVPAPGGPTGVAKAAPTTAAQLSVYTVVSNAAQALQTSGGGWSHSLMVEAPLSDGDIGAPVLTGKGQALGMVSGVPTANGTTLVSDLYREIRYLHTLNRFADVRLAKGTVKFTSGVPLPVGSA